MSKIGNHVVGIQESEDYRFGWESAERGEPMPPHPTDRSLESSVKHAHQFLGWKDYHDWGRSP